MNGLSTSLQQFFSDIFASSSKEAYDINTLFFEFLILAGCIIFLIAFLVITGAIKYRSAVRPDEPKQVSGNKGLEIIWTLIPLVIVSFFFVLTVKVMAEINQPFKKGRQPDIVIIAHQWWWDMRYPKYHVITANELHIPVGKKFLIRVESADVIHDWWVPALGRKIDAIPGHLNYSWIESDRTGQFGGACSEYCGEQHAWMRILVVAQPQEEFNTWIRNQQRIDSVPASGVNREGALLFQQKTCANCHAISGTPADAHIGPDLSHLGSRQTLLSGMMANTPQNLALWLKDPQKVKEGARMPDFMLDKNEINELTTYLENLK